MPTPTPLILRPFLESYTDAIRLADASLIADQIDLSAALAKSSILHSVFAIEAMANGFLSGLGYSSKLLEGLDRLQPLEKLDIAVSSRFGQQLDRGRLETQRIADLFALRNAYVHAKARNVTTTYHQDEKILELPTESWNALQIQKEPHRWRSPEAKKCLIAVDDFVSYYCKTLAGFSTPQAMKDLLPGILVDKVFQVTIVIEHRDILRGAKKTWNLKLDWIDLEGEFEEIIDARDSTVTKLHIKG
jgi:hypothetical protein